MKSPVAVMVLAVLAAGTAGCSDSMRGYLEKDTPVQQQAAVRQDLTMPPDLSLAPPGSAPAAPDNGSYAEPAPAQPVYNNQAVTTAPVTPAAPAPGSTTVGQRATAADGVYEKAGISLTKPDGTRKTQGELQAEYKAWYMAQKRQQNPNYGTVFNMGNVFKDE